jgi:hypothetical protein
MKKILAAFSLSFLVLAAGCESVSDMKDGVSERLNARNEPKVRVFAADQRATYAAALRAVGQMDYRFLHGGPAQGRLEAVSGLSTNDTLNGSRQIQLKLTLRPAIGADPGTEMSLWLNEIIEADSTQKAGQGTSSPLRDTPLYEVFFRTVQQALDAAKKG